MNTIVSAYEFWKRHKRKIAVATIVVGGGYAAYTAYRSIMSGIQELQEGQDERLAVAALLNNSKETFELCLLAVHQANAEILSKVFAAKHDALIAGLRQANNLEEKLLLWEGAKALAFTALFSSAFLVVAEFVYVAAFIGATSAQLAVTGGPSLYRRSLEVEPLRAYLRKHVAEHAKVFLSKCIDVLTTVNFSDIPLKQRFTAEDFARLAREAEAALSSKLVSSAPGFFGAFSWAGTLCERDGQNGSAMNNPFESMLKSIVFSGPAIATANVAWSSSMSIVSDFLFSSASGSGTASPVATNMVPGSPLVKVLPVVFNCYTQLCNSDLLIPSLLKSNDVENFLFWAVEDGRSRLMQTQT